MATADRPGKTGGRSLWQGPALPRQRRIADVFSPIDKDRPLAERIRVGTVIGSLREGSLNRMVERRFADHGKDRMDVREIDIRDLPMFNQDLEATPPAEWVRLRDAVREVDAIAFFTPEYNRSVPAVLKNAIDVGSRPYGQSVWAGKPAIVVSGSIGATGGFGANHALRQSLSFLDMPTMQQPEAYLGGLADKFGPDGTIMDDSLDGFIAKIAAAAADWYAKILK